MPEIDINLEPCSEGVAIVIFGVTGDLARRKLMPALYENAKIGRLPEPFYILAFLFPEKINKVAALASFIPQTWRSSIDTEWIKNKDFFIAHGSQDEIIPINKASESAKWLEEHQANVTFCEANIGHKLSADCFKGLGNFFSQ